MDNQVENSLKEIQSRPEQMDDKKNLEKEIESLSEELQGLECTYERLQMTYKSNLREYALKQVNLEVAKQMHSCIDEILKKRLNLLEDEQLKLDELHWTIWKEEDTFCDTVHDCIANHDSVKLLNEFPSALNTVELVKTGQDYDLEMKTEVENHPEVTKLRMEVAQLEAELAESCTETSEEELVKVVAQLEELRRNFDKGNETKRLIKALEQSHEERMKIEAEIAEIERRTEMELCEKFVKSENTVTKSEQVEMNHSYYFRPGEGDISTKSEVDTIETEDSSLVCQETRKQQAKLWWKRYLSDLESSSPEEKKVNVFYSQPYLNIESNRVETTADNQACQEMFGLPKNRLQIRKPLTNLDSLAKPTASSEGKDVKFVPKVPSNIAKRITALRQRKTDGFP